MHILMCISIHFVMFTYVMLEKKKPYVNKVVLHLNKSVDQTNWSEITWPRLTEMKAAKQPYSLNHKKKVKMVTTEELELCVVLLPDSRRKDSL